MAISQRQYAVNGINLNVWACGPETGPVMLFLHGFPEAGFAWSEQLQFFGAKGYRVLAPDQRGYNLSSKPRGIRNYTINLLVGDIVGLIKAVTSEPVILVGHDWGGGVAWHLAMQHPLMVQKLVIINMPHPQVMQQTLKKSINQQIRSSYAGFFQLPVLPELVSSLFDYSLLVSTLRRSAHPGIFTQTKLQQYKAAWRQPGALTSMINWYRAYRFFKPKPTALIQSPTLLIWGQQDAFLQAGMALPSVAHCADGQLKLVPDATHWIHHEHPGLVNGLIRSFLNEKKHKPVE